jgi:hypothetical protein
MADKKVDAEVRRANLSFLQIIFPSFLLVLIPSVINESALLPLVMKILIFGYQYYIVQTFVNSMYS